MKGIITISILFLSLAGGAQDSVSGTGFEPRGVAVVVHKDPRIDLLIKKQGSINTATKKSMARTARGYRLLVSNTNKREEAIAAKTRIFTYFPELSAYMSYQSPYFRVKAGNFQTREEAVRYQKTMNTLFPKGVFIINDIVEVKPEKVEEFDEK